MKSTHLIDAQVTYPFRDNKSIGAERTRYLERTKIVLMPRIKNKSEHGAAVKAGRYA
jgi:hypothetical protein